MSISQTMPRVPVEVSKNWWMLVLRGVLAILFGVVALLVPGTALIALVLVFGFYALLDGGVSFFHALTHRGRPRWWVGLLEGIVGIGIGILTFLWPGITGLALLYLIAFWAILTGILEVVAAIQLRKEIENEWLLGLGGVLSVAFGVLLIISPVSGALAIAWLIGIYAIMFGVTLIVLGFRLRNRVPSVNRTNQTPLSPVDTQETIRRSGA